MSVKCIHVPPYTPLLYSKTCVHVCRGIFIFLIFGPKHRLCELTIYDLSKNQKNIKFSFFTMKHLTCVFFMQPHYNAIFEIHGNRLFYK